MYKNKKIAIMILIFFFLFFFIGLPPFLVPVVMRVYITHIVLRLRKVKRSGALLTTLLRQRRRASVTFLYFRRINLFS